MPYPLKPRRLGPRSLSPPLFLERCVRAYSRPGCCLPTSATAYDVRTKDPGLPFPRRDGGHDHLPFLTHHARPLRVAPKSGDTRRAALRPSDRDPGAGSSWLPRFARPRYLDRRDTLLVRACGFHRPHKNREVQCRLTCTGLWTERRTCPRARRRFLGVYHEECVRLAHADHVPLLILPEDTCCHRCDRMPGNEPQSPVTDRPRPKLLRHPAKAAGIPWIRVPSTVAAAGT